MRARTHPRGCTALHQRSGHGPGCRGGSAIRECLYDHLCVSMLPRRRLRHQPPVGNGADQVGVSGLPRRGSSGLSRTDALAGTSRVGCRDRPNRKIARRARRGVGRAATAGPRPKFDRDTEPRLAAAPATLNARRLVASLWTLARARRNPLRPGEYRQCPETTHGR